MNNTLSNRVVEWSVLPTAKLHGKILAMQQKGQAIIDLTIGISNVPIPDSGKHAAIAAIQTNNVPYTAIGGSDALKKTIQEKLARENGMRVKPENIIVTTGAKQAIFQALYCVTNPRDEVILFTPCWPAYTQIMTMLKLKPVFLTLSDLQTLPDKKVSKKAKILIVNNPHNPTGKLFTKAELTQLAAFAKKHNLIVLADESYEKLVYDGSFINFSTIAPQRKEKLITVFSISQSFSMMGWRLGYAVAQSSIIEAMEAVQSSITAATSAVTQAAITEILAKEHTYGVQLQKAFAQRRDAIYEKLSGISWLRCELPRSGPYFWCNIESLTNNTLDFSMKLLEQQHIAVMPGNAFGAPGWIRIAFNVQPVTVLETAITKIRKFGDTYEGKRT